MGRKQLATKELVMEAVQKLLAEGTDPSPNTIRDLIGVGTYSRLGPLITECLSDIRATEVSVMQLKPELAQLGTSLFQDAVSRIWADVESDSKRHIAEIERNSAAKIAGASDRTTKAYELADGLEAELDAAREATAAAHRDMRAAQERAAATEGRMTEQMAQHKQERARVAAEAERAVAAERRALDQAAEARGLIAALREQVAELTARVSSQSLK